MENGKDKPWETKFVCSSLIHISTQTMAINANPTPTRINTHGNKPVLSIREFQITFIRSLAVLLIDDVLQYTPNIVTHEGFKERDKNATSVITNS